MLIFHTPCFVLDSNLIRLASRATFPKGEGLLTDYQLPHPSRFANHLPQMEGLTLPFGEGGPAEPVGEVN